MQLTAEQRQFVEAAQGRPVEVVDPQTGQVYALLSAEGYQCLRAFVERQVAEKGPATTKAKRASARTFEGPQLRVRVRELAVPPEVAERVKRVCRKLCLWRCRYVQEVEDELKLQSHFGGQYVGFLSSPEGPLVVAAGVLQSEAFDRQLGALSSQERRRVFLEAVDPWNDPVSRILSSLSA
jgi:hypothetical protein